MHEVTASVRKIAGIFVKHLLSAMKVADLFEVLAILFKIANIRVKSLLSTKDSRYLYEVTASILKTAGKFVKHLLFTIWIADSIKGVLHPWALFLKIVCIFSKNTATLDKVSNGSDQKCSNELKNHSFISVETMVVMLL